jgi:integrase
VLVNGRWTYAVNDLSTGKRRRLSSRELDRRRADGTITAMAERWLLEEREGALVPIDFGTAYTEFLKTTDVRASTMASYAFGGRVYARGFPGKQLHQITTADVEGFLVDLRERGRTARTRAYHLTALRGLFQWAVRRRYCRSNPCDGIRAPKGTPKSYRALTIDESRRLVQESERTSHLYLAVLITLYTGLRRRNVLGLRWKDVDLEKWIISIDGSRMKNHSAIELPVHPELLTVLRDRQQSLGGIDGVNEEDRVIGRIASTLNTSWRNAVARAGIPGYAFHSLRRTVATRLMEGATPYPVLKAILGHVSTGSGDVTLRYCKVSACEKAKWLSSLPSLLTPQNE